ncbi:MAG: hypothetical protein II348_04630 [Clostridia bacterium]|nr:hypothetical protein [Clostridia bacterium]
MNFVWVFGIVLVAVFGSHLLRRTGGEFAQFLPLTAVVLLLSALLPSVESVLESIQILGQRAGVDATSVGVVLRGIGIGLVTRLASSVCVDGGQRALGETVEYCGQIAIVSMAVPFLSNLVEKLMEVEF